MSERPVALVTGGARRIGAAIVERLHADGYRVLIHCHRSRASAEQLAIELNSRREDSARIVEGDLAEQAAIDDVAETAIGHFGRIDLLVNNASRFFPTAVGTTSREAWSALVESNFAAPFFLTQCLLSRLRETRGNVVNLIDIHAERPLAGHAVYSAAKAGLHMLTRALAVELAPDVRVNGIAPGAILWPEQGTSDAARAEIIAKTPLGRLGTPEDIAEAVIFLARSAYITGQVLAVDGGRSLQ